MTKVKDMKTAEELRKYLLKPFSFTGGKSKNNVYLYHYASIRRIISILQTGFIWLGSPKDMNDLLECQLIDIDNNSNKSFYSCFSRAEENLAMYKMYADGEDGAVLCVPFTMAELMLKNTKNNDQMSAYIVRNNVLTSETVEADIYWATVMYKDLHTNSLISESVINKNISRPFSEKALLGLVKLYGWSYEREVRLVASLSKDLENGEKLALKLPEDFCKNVKVILSPQFSRQKKMKEYAQLMKTEVSIVSSAYDGLVKYDGKK